MQIEDIIKPEFLPAFRLGVQEGWRLAGQPTCASPQPDINIARVFPTIHGDQADAGVNPILAWEFKADSVMPDELAVALAEHGFEHSICTRRIKGGLQVGLAIKHKDSASFFDALIEAPAVFILDDAGCHVRELVGDAHPEASYVLW